MIVYHTVHMDKQRRVSVYWQIFKYSPRDVHSLKLQRANPQAGFIRFVQSEKPVLFSQTSYIAYTTLINLAFSVLVVLMCFA